MALNVEVAAPAANGANNENNTCNSNSSQHKIKSPNSNYHSAIVRKNALVCDSLNQSQLSWAALRGNLSWWETLVSNNNKEIYSSKDE